MIPNESIKIETADGSIFVYKMSDVQKITKDDAEERTNTVRKNPLSSRSDKLTYGLIGYISMPSGDFADDIDIKSGFAKTGFGAGFELAMPIGSPGLYWLSTAALIYNPADISAASAKNMTGDDVTMEFSPWINIPLSSGLKYQAQISPAIDFYGLGQLSFNFCNPPTVDVSEQHADNSVTTESLKADMATSIGFIIGGGIVINTNYEISLRYLMFGKQKISYPIPGKSTPWSYEPSISILTITFGYHLN